MRLGLIAFVFCFVFSVKPTHAEGETTRLQDMLIMAKITGACGVLSSMSSFQKTTKMDGGDEFITRFWNTEASRLGHTPEEYIERCNKAISIYDEYYASLEKMKEE